MKVKLTRQQYQLLEKFMPKNHPELWGAVNEGIIQSNKTHYYLELDESVAEEIRDWAGEMLQQVGFGDNGEPNDTGRILEDLMEIFFMG